MAQARITLTGSFLLFAGCLYAQPQQKLNIEQATVFLSGAELTSTAKVTLVKGENEFIFTNVAGDVNSQSLTVSATNGVVVEAATFQNNYLAAEVLSPRATILKDSIEQLGVDTQLVHNKLMVLGHESGSIWKNSQVSGANTGLSVAELQKYLDLIDTKMEAILDKQDVEKAKLKKLKDHLTKLGQQLTEEQGKGYQPGGQLLVKFYAKEATTADIAVDYVVPHAGWSPTYDIFADDANGPVKLFYKANIFQNSGVKWNNVRLSLSTGDPNEGAQAPTMNPWYLAFYYPQTNGYANMSANAPGMYKSKRAEEVNIGGGRTSGTEYMIDGLIVQGTSGMNEYVSVDNAGINTSFDIDLPYTIPSDGQQHLVAIKKYELPATYRYYAVPKMDKDAFLQAQITNWEDLNLLPGKSNIFYEGTYVGQGNIDVRNVTDTMTLSLGRDKKIVVKRNRDTKLRSVKTIGTNIRETFSYTITVRNTRKEAINLIVQDQQPVSNDKDIVIDEKDAGTSEYNDTTGMMKWALQLVPNETKNVSFGYTVRYPRGKTVVGLR